MIELSEHKVNQDVDPKIIDTAVPTESGWDVQITPWGK